MGIEPTGTVTLTFPRQQDVDLGGYYEIYGALVPAAISYAAPLMPGKLPAWPDGEGVGGFGTEFGDGAFGLEADGAGFGGGFFGLGPFGFDDGVVEAALNDLADGAYSLAAVAHDEAGNATTPATLIALAVVAGSPAAPRNLWAGTLAAGRLTLTFTRSPDDEAA